jgi:hypothetical protein
VQLRRLGCVALRTTNQPKRDTHTHAHGGKLKQCFLEHAARPGSWAERIHEDIVHMHCRHAWCTNLRLASMCIVTTRESNEQPFSAQRMKAGCSIAGHLRTQDVSYMIRSAWQARNTRTGRLGSTTEVTTVVTNEEHVRNEREQDTAEQSRCMTRGEQTYQAGRQVRMRVDKGKRSVKSHAVMKGKNSEHVRAQAY